MATVIHLTSGESVTVTDDPGVVQDAFIQRQGKNLVPFHLDDGKGVYINPDHVTHMREVVDPSPASKGPR